MNLYGSITDFQNTLVELYLQLEHRFKENGLIRELWSAMAHDVSLQISSLKVLPPSFWTQLKKNHDGLLEVFKKGATHQVAEKKEDLSLPGCFELALNLEEPVILKIYAPIIRSLRKDLTYPALNFYIMVKAHLARIVRVTESFSGDPVVIQRSNLLQQGFEKEVQEPQVVEVKVPAWKVLAGQPARERKPEKKQKRILKPVPALAKHGKIHHSRTKPLVKKVSLQRRRAHR